MASKSTGIALLSMYYDEDDDMEDLNEKNEDKEVKNDENEELKNDENENLGSSDDMTPQVNEDNSTFKVGIFRSTTLQTTQISGSSPVVRRTIRRGTVTIVDYGHDEVAMSPEPEAEEGEILSGAELQTANGDLREQMPGTPSTQATPQVSGQLDASQTDTMNYSVSESEAVEVEGGVRIAVEVSKDIDPLDKFLPSPPEEKCSDELQDRINKFLALKRAGKSFNAEVRNKKDYRNPDFLLHAVRYQDIDQIGSCFSKDVFDPHGYDKSDYYDEIEVDMKREMERKEQEKKKSQKVDFLSGGIQPGSVIGAPKIGMPIQGVPTGGAGGLPSVPIAPDAVTRDGRQNKKSKWDKVDGDRRNPLPSGGQDSLSNVGAHAAILAAATNAGSGYTAFAQQRRREVEEKRSSERRRS